MEGGGGANTVDTSTDGGYTQLHYWKHTHTIAQLHTHPHAPLHRRSNVPVLGG